MGLHQHESDRSADDANIELRPQFSEDGEPSTIPRFRLGEGPLTSDTAYQIVHDELMLDGNARMNLATFVTTWMEPRGAAHGRVRAQEPDRQGRVPPHRGARAALRQHPRVALARAGRWRGDRLLDHGVE